MPYTSKSELYFIIAMMFLILIVCATACYFFFKTFRHEREAKELAVLKRKIEQEKIAAAQAETAATSETVETK